MKTIKFSIVVTVYNAEKFLEECISSIINQKYSNFELILVNDGSSDSSKEICEKYKMQYPDKIIVFNQQNRGQIIARIKGVSIATGEYVCCVDSDDVVSNDFLLKINNVLQYNKADVVLWGYTTIDEKGRHNYRKRIHEFKTGFIEKHEFIDTWRRQPCLNALWRKMIRKDLMDVWNSIDNDFIIRGGDLYLSIPVVEQAKTFYYLSEDLLLYRINGHSISNTYKKNVWKTNHTVRICQYEFLRRQGFNKEEDKNIFFKIYFNELWNVLIEIRTSRLKFDEKKKIFNEILMYDLMKIGKKYIDKKKIGKKLYKRLKLLYQKKWVLVDIILSCDEKRKMIKNVLRMLLFRFSFKRV